MYDLIKQPNGKYCCVSYSGVIQFDNYSEQDVIDMYIEEAKRAICTARASGEIIKRFVRGDQGNGAVGEARLQPMGFDKPYSELAKYVPRKPTNTQYVGHDCTTYGKCPNCGQAVQDGIGFKQEKCSECGQLLDWQ